MAAEVLVIGLFLVIVVAAFLFLRKPKKELTAAERMAYESERGKLLAQQEFEKRSRW